MPEIPELNYRPPQGRSSKLAIISVVLGAVAIPADVAFLAGMPIGLAAIILGVISLVKIRRNPDLTGKVPAIIGIALGGTALLLGTACGWMISTGRIH